MLEEDKRQAVNYLWFAGAVVCGVVMNLGVTQPKTVLQGFTQAGVGVAVAVSCAPAVNDYLKIPAESSTHYTVVSVVTMFGFFIANSAFSLFRKAQEEQWLYKWTRKRLGITDTESHAEDKKDAG